MSQAISCLVALLLAASAFAQTPPRDAPARDASAPATGTAVIRGRVLVAGADRPLSRVEVRAFCSPLKVDKAVLTDGNGRYEIAELPAGRYTVGFLRTNYVRASYGQRRLLGPGAPIDIAAGQVVTRIDAALQRSGAVTGRIVDEFGDPIARVQVIPMRYIFSNGARRLQPVGRGGGMTDDLGEYRLFDLAPGRYFFSATLRNFEPGDASNRTAYAPTYYPGTANAAEAQPLTIAPGQTMPAINITLLPVAAVRVSGVALDGRGRPMAGAYVNLAQRFFSAFGSGFTKVQPDGTFTIGGVTPGDYTLRVAAPGAPDEVGTAVVTVSTADIDNIEVVAVKKSTLSGRFVLEAGGTKPPLLAALRVNVVHPDSLTAMYAQDTPKDDGTFEIKTDPGRTLIRAGVYGPSDWRLKRVLSADGTPVTDTGFDVPPNATVAGLIVELTSRHPELSGRVVDAAGASIRDCVVVVFSRDDRQWTAETRYFGVGRPDQDNVFHVRIPAGDYYAAAFELDDAAVSLNDPEIMRQLRDRATMFSICDAEKKTLALMGEPPVY
jgi:hypothetical protein